MSRFVGDKSRDNTQGVFPPCPSPKRVASATRLSYSSSRHINTSTMYRPCVVVLAVALVLSPVNAFVGVNLAGQAVRKPLVLNQNAAARPHKMALRSLKMQEQQNEDGQAPVPPPPPPSATNQQVDVGGAVPWFERTTTLDRSLRVGGDPLAPKKNPVMRDMSSE
eukprot:953703-Rhodomonas_salina.1